MLMELHVFPVAAMTKYILSLGAYSDERVLIGQQFNQSQWVASRGRARIVLIVQPLKVLANQRPYELAAKLLYRRLITRAFQFPDSK